MTVLGTKGLVKLIEECGELSQIAAKKLAFLHTDEHPDKKGSLRERLEDEIADVLAAAQFVTAEYALDAEKISERAQRKLDAFFKWETD